MVNLKPLVMMEFYFTNVYLVPKKIEEEETKTKISYHMIISFLFLVFTPCLPLTLQFSLSPGIGSVNLKNTIKTNQLKTGAAGSACRTGAARRSRAPASTSAGTAPPATASC